MNASNFGVVQRDDTMRRAMEAIDESGLQMVAVIDRRRQLCGVITDSDVDAHAPVVTTSPPGCSAIT